MLKASALSEYRRHVRAAFVEKPRQSWLIFTAGRLTTVRHSLLATHTSETVHPQFQTGSIAARLASSYMRVHQLGLAHRVRGHPDVRGITCRFRTLGWDITQKEYDTY